MSAGSGTLAAVGSVIAIYDLIAGTPTAEDQLRRDLKALGVKIDELQDFVNQRANRSDLHTVFSSETATIEAAIGRFTTANTAHRKGNFVDSSMTSTLSISLDVTELSSVCDTGGDGQSFVGLASPNWSLPKMLYELSFGDEILAGSTEMDLSEALLAGQAA